jgi:hypothetical protein
MKPILELLYLFLLYEHKEGQKQMLNIMIFKIGVNKVRISF